MQQHHFTITSVHSRKKPDAFVSLNWNVASYLPFIVSHSKAKTSHTRKRADNKYVWNEIETRNRAYTPLKRFSTLILAQIILWFDWHRNKFSCYSSLSLSPFSFNLYLSLSSLFLTYFQWRNCSVSNYDSNFIRIKFFVISSFVIGIFVLRLFSLFHFHSAIQSTNFHHALSIESILSIIILMATQIASVSNKKFQFVSIIFRKANSMSFFFGWEIKSAVRWGYCFLFSLQSVIKWTDCGKTSNALNNSKNAHGKLTTTNALLRHFCIWLSILSLSEYFSLHCSFSQFNMIENRFHSNSSMSQSRPHIYYLVRIRRNVVTLLLVLSSRANNRILRSCEGQRRDEKRMKAR